jgi:gliding motility-associated-like protein
MTNYFFRRYSPRNTSSGLILFLFPYKSAALLLLVTGLSFPAAAQVCDCPAASECGACQGGLTSLTLRLNTIFPFTITAYDQGGLIFSGVVGAGDTFTITGSQRNEKFVGPTVSLRVAGSPNASIGTGCASDVDVGDRFGLFTVVAGTSKSGGAICCHPSDVDDDAPDIDNCPSNRMVNLPASACTVAVNWNAPTADDDCTVVSFESNYKPGDQFAVGSTQVEYVAKDKAGNTARCRFTITVVDVTRPEIVNCPPSVNVVATSACQAAVTWTPPTATDNCTGVTITSTHSPGASFPLGTTKVTYTARDTRGNTRECSFDIHVTDGAGPSFTDCPADINVVEDNACNAVVNWAPPKVVNGCSGGVTVSSTHKPGASFPMGTTTVTYTATDSRGNKGTCTFKVSVTSGQGPVVTACPESITVKSDERGEAVVTWEEPEGVAGCGRVSVKRTHAPGSTFATGTTPVLYTFTDNAGREATCSFNIIVLPTEIVVDIAKAVTPDGDGIHDLWELTNIEKYKDNTVLVIDRWGNKIFEARGYDNEHVSWDGRSHQGVKVPTGTYFYTVEVRVQNVVWRQKGSLEVIQ